MRALIPAAAVLKGPPSVNCGCCCTHKHTRTTSHVQDEKYLSQTRRLGSLKEPGKREDL